MPAHRNVATPALIEARSIPEPNTGCWLWEGKIGNHGYGVLVVAGKSWLAHRLAWTVFHGPIPDGMQVLHKCDTRPCVNAPDHMFLGTIADNMVDKGRKGRAPRGEANPRAKITPAVALAIRASTGTVSDAAVRFGVSRSLVSIIRRGEVWKHLPMEAS